MTDSRRALVRQQLSLPITPRKPWGSAHRVLRVVVLLAALTTAWAAQAQAPYRQEWLRGLAGLDVGSGSSPALADLDGDGDLDLAVGTNHRSSLIAEPGTLHMFLNTGTPSAPAYAEVHASADPFAGIMTFLQLHPAFGDLDSDGDPDLVIGSSVGELGYFSNTGSTAAPAYAMMTGDANPFLGVSASSGEPEFADLDGDGDLDMVLGQKDGAVRYFPNTGSSKALPGLSEMTGSDNPFHGIDVGAYSEPALADLDADGDLDAVVGNGFGTPLYFLNTGSSTEPAFEELTGTANPFSAFPAGGPPVLADADADGDIDAMLGKPNGGMRYLVNTGSSTEPSFALATGNADLFSSPDIGSSVKPTLADLDADGDFDVVIGEHNGTLHYLSNTGNSLAAAFEAVTGTENPFAGIDVGFLSSPTFADLDADGDLDGVVGALAGSPLYFINTGNPASPGFAEATGSANPLSAVQLFSHSTPELADFDSDGDFDAVIGDSYFYSGYLHYFINTGSSTAPAFAQALGTSDPFSGWTFYYNAPTAIGDFDSDGDLDVAIGGFLGKLALLANTGSPFSPAFAVSMNPFPGFDVGTDSTPAIADLDGDGDLDVLVGDAGGSIAFLRSLANDVFKDGFESGDTSAWSGTVP